MNRWGLLAAGLGAYALALAATAPATLADAGLQHASQGRLRITEASGTLWAGSGVVEMRATAGQGGVIQSLAWRVQPQSLLRGHLVYDLKLENTSPGFPLTLSVSGIELANAELRLPAALLSLGVPRLAPLGLTGEVFIHVASLSIARDRVTGQASIQWRAAGSSLVSLSPLGDYEVRLHGQGKTVDALLSTIEGPLRLDGKGTWSNGGPAEISAFARVPAEHQAQLAPLLRLIAVERGAGNFELRLN